MIQISLIERVFKKHYRSAVFYAQRIVQRKEVAEDIVQNVFLKFMSGEITVRGDLSVYLYTAVHNRCIDYIRMRRLTDTTTDELAEELEDIAPDFHPENELFVRTLHMQRLYEAIEDLPPKRRRIFCMIQLERLSYAETADALGISINSVRTQMYRAMRFLKSTLRNGHTSGRKHTDREESDKT